MTTNVTHVTGLSAGLSPSRPTRKHIILGGGHGCSEPRLKTLPVSHRDPPLQGPGAEPRVRVGRDSKSPGVTVGGLGAALRDRDRHGVERAPVVPGTAGARASLSRPVSADPPLWVVHQVGKAGLRRLNFVSGRLRELET